MKRFELGDRHWSFEVRGDLVDFAWGSAGGMTQTHSRRLASPEEAEAYAEMQVVKQRALGFVEVPASPPAHESPSSSGPPERRTPEAPVSRSIRFEIAAEKRTSFRRYPRPARFHELEQRDRVVIERSGELDPEDGEKAPRRETTYDTIAEASEVYDDGVQGVRDDSHHWTQVSSSRVPVVHREPALEAQCWAAADDDPAPWSVYMDWLLEQGDPLGELATAPTNAAAKRRFDAELEELGIAHRLVTIELRHGFPRVATIKTANLDDADPTRLAFAARAVRTCGLGRFVDVLRFGLAGYTDANDWAPTLRALAEAPHPELIRELYFNAYEYTDCEISWATMGQLDGLFAPFTGLEVLHLKSGAGGTLGELDLPNLRRLIRESGGLSASEIASITTATWPALEHLEIWFGSPSYGADSTVAALRPVFDRARFPRLRHLGIVNCAWVEDAIAALAASRLLPELHSLDLSKGILARRGALLLRQHATLFRHLASIDLSANLLLPREAAQIRDVLDNVILVDQREREMEDYEEAEADGETVRYVAVGE